jgi:signal peptidase II
MKGNIMRDKKINLYVLAGLIIIIDQLSKWLIRNNLPLNKTVTIINKLLYITHITNIGAAFGIVPNGRWFFIIIGAISVILIIILVSRLSLKRILTIAIGLVLGGLIGNLIDRIFLGYVTDFIDVKFFSVFNIADSALTIGVAIALLYILGTWKKPLE